MPGRPRVNRPVASTWPHAYTLPPGARQPITGRDKCTMPIYEYVCESCGCEFEELSRSVSGDDVNACPACRSKALTRKVSLFAASRGESESGHRASGDMCGRCDADGSCPVRGGPFTED